jgi:ribosome-associated protein
MGTAAALWLPRGTRFDSTVQRHEVCMTVKRKASSASDSTAVRRTVKARAAAKLPQKTRRSGSAAGKQAARAATPKSTRAVAPKAAPARRAAPAKRPAPAKRGAAAKTARKSGNVVVHTPKPKPVLPPAVVGVVEHALGEMKAANVKVLDVHELTDIADTLVIASGNSDRHVRAIADRVVEEAKKSGFRPMGIEGERDGEWVLVDLQDVIVHIMLPRVREFYRLESLWDVSAARREVVQSA